MVKLKQFIIGTLLLLIAIACSKNSSKLFKKKEINAIEIDSDLIRHQNFSINYNKKASEKSITLKYLGSGGYYFSYGKAAFIIDPFFSPYQVVPLAIKKISTQT